MKKNRASVIVMGTLVAVLATSCASSPLQAGQQGQTVTGHTPSAEGTSSLQAPSPTQHPARERLSIPAPSLADNLIEEPTEQGIEVSVPAGYDTSDSRYPVVYYLPGFGDPFDVFVTGASATMILVAINGINRLGGSFYYNSPVTGNWEDFVTKDVVEYIDSHYRTIAEPDGRAIVGHSMGGFGVLNAAMHTNVYSYAYAMSPGVFNEDGLKDFALQFPILSDFTDSVADLDDETARVAYLERIDSLSWPANVSFAYASAFAPDAVGRPPYIEIPQRDEAGEYIHDATWDKYNEGYGGLPAKLDQYGDNLRKLKGFVIEYGTSDEFTFIPEGCDYLSGQLTERGIAHELLTYSGGHGNKLYSRIGDVMLPYLAEKFGV